MRVAAHRTARCQCQGFASTLEASTPCREDFSIAIEVASISGSSIKRPLTTYSIRLKESAPSAEKGQHQGDPFRKEKELQSSSYEGNG